jgi:VIT1/CCC1 family predicted Fe2+/Mn2+ transporter
MGYQPKSKLRELAAKAEFLHMIIFLAFSSVAVLLIFVPALILNDGVYAPIWVVVSMFLSIPVLLWSHGKSQEIAIWWVMRPENTRLAEENAKVLRNRIIRESEEFITECRGKNEIQS